MYVRGVEYVCTCTRYTLSTCEVVLYTRYCVHMYLCNMCICTQYKAAHMQGSPQECTMYLVHSTCTYSSSRPASIGIRISKIFRILRHASFAEARLLYHHCTANEKCSKFPKIWNPVFESGPFGDPRVSVQSRTTISATYKLAPYILRANNYVPVWLKKKGAPDH